jgi:hypothetical protein
MPPLTIATIYSTFWENLIHAQVRQIQRSALAQSRTARAHDSATVSVCMLRRIEAYMDAHRVLSGLTCDQALLRAVALGYARYNVLLAACANRTSTDGELPLLGLKKLGRRDVCRWHIAPCTTACVHGSSTVHRLRVRVSTFTRMLACVTGLGRGPGAVRAQLRGLWFGPHGP